MAGDSEESTPTTTIQSERAMLLDVDLNSAVTQRSLRLPALASKKRMLALAGGVSLALGASALVAYQHFGPCIPAAEEQNSIVSLYEAYPHDLVNLMEEGDDPELMTQWLRETSMAKAKAQESRMDGKSMEDLRKEMDKVLETSDPKEARKLAEKAIANAVKLSQKKRASLKKYLKSHRRNLKHKPKLTPWEQAQVANCVFDSLSATTSVASIAANFNDAAKTCWGVNPMDLVAFNTRGAAAVHTNVCSVNVFAVIGAVVGLAGTLSAAADDCAATLIPNVDALCAQSVMGLAMAVAGTGGAATLMNSACRGNGWYHDIPPGLVPSNLGSNEYYFENPHEARRLETEAEGASAATPRELLFGGGKGSTAAQCTIEITSAMWALASAALGINAAGNRGLGGSCPPENILTGSKHKGKSLLYTVPQGICVTDVSQVLVGFLGAITYMELASVNCLDVLNVGAICGAGATGLMTAMAGISQAATGVWLTCDVAQIPIFHKILDIATELDKHTGNLVSKELLGGSYDNKKRRLLERVENDIEDLKARFKTPEEAFMSIGYNLTDADAEWRIKDTAPPIDAEHLAEILQNKDEVKSSLFGGASKTCEA